MRHSNCHPVLLALLALLATQHVFAQNAEPVVGVQSFIVPDAELASLKKDALAGSGPAAYRLAQYYGFAALDFDKQLYWMTIAAENGDLTGTYGLGWLLANKSSEIDKLRARYWLERSRDQGQEPIATLARSRLRELDAGK
jgi:TPR repeat protein